jgi:filamentous hemagglutinin family protein
MNHRNRSNRNTNSNSNSTIKVTALSLMLSFATHTFALPVGGGVSAGTASIGNSASNMTITQSTSNAAITWQSFNIGQSESVKFVQPNSSSVMLNRVMGSDPSSIFGSLSANGKVFLVNPNGILFGNTAQVNVGGLVASTRNITDSDFMSGIYKFTGTGNGTVLNQGTITTNADGSYVALIGGNVSNNGMITARLGTVALAAGNAITLDVAGDSLLNVIVNQGAVNALVQNGGLIQADGGLVLLTTQAAGNLLQSVVNNSGLIQAQTIENHNGTIKLLADMQSGSVNVSGTLTALGGLNSGDGGFIETSASHVVVTGSAKIDTLAPHGNTGLWLLDPVNYTIAATGGDETPASVTASLAASNRLITASNDITVADTISLTSAQTLTLNAGHDVLINAPISAVPAGAGLALIAGNNINVGAALSVTGAGSSISLNAKNDVTVAATIMAVGAASPIKIYAGHDVFSNAAITAIAAGTAVNLSAGRNVNVNSALTASAAGSSISLLAGLGATSPGAGGGTVIFAPTATSSSIGTTIRFNPLSYTNTSSEIAAYLSKVTGIMDAKAWLFARANNKTYNGTNAATLSFMGVPSAGGDVKMIPGSATFDTSDAGTGKLVTFSNATISGIDAGKFALFTTSGTTTANITPASLTVTAANATKTYGQTMTLSGFTVEGLVNGETIGAFTETSPGTAATAIVEGSPYAITLGVASGGTFKLANYGIVYVNGELSVTPQPLVAMSVKSLASPDFTTMPRVMPADTSAELINILPVKSQPVESALTSPKI